MSNTLLSPLPSLRLSDRYPAGNIHTLPMAPSTSTSAAKTQILRHAGTGPTPRTPTKSPRPHSPFKPAVPSESGQVAQNLALNPHRPTLPPAHSPPRFPPSRLFGRLPPCSPSRSDWQASENP